jgi:hypothetical protein
MQAKPARHRGKTPALAALAAALLGAGAASAQGDGDTGRKILRPGPAPNNAAARCALYGEGFVPIVGADGCVRIGGRLRIDLGGSTPAPSYAPPHDGFSPAAHLRVGR